MKKLKSFLVISAIVFCAMFCTMSANAQGVGGKAGTGGKGGFGGGQASSSFTPGVTAIAGTCSTGETSCDLTTMSVTAGQFAIVCIGTDDTTAETYTLTNNNSDPTPSQVTGFPFAGTTVRGTCFYQKIQTTNASYVLTCGDSNPTPDMGCVGAVYTGIPTSGWDVTLAGASTGTTSCPYTTTTGTSGTTANASELGIAFFIAPAGPGATFSGLSGWTVRAEVSIAGISVGIADNILSSTQTLTATATLNCGASVASGAFVSSIK